MRISLKHGLPLPIKAAYGHGKGVCALYTGAGEVGDDTAQTMMRGPYRGG